MLLGDSATTDTSDGPQCDILVPSIAVGLWWFYNIQVCVCGYWVECAMPAGCLMNALI